MGDQGGQSTGASAGWYDDPLTPGGKRYWDGTRWTEAVHGPNPALTPGASVGSPPLGPASASAGMDGSLPFEPLPPGAHAVGSQGGGGAIVGDGKINDFGDWLQRSFTVVFANWLPAAILHLISIPFWVAALLAAHRAVGQATWFIGADDVRGFNTPLLILAGLLVVAAVAAGLIGYLGGHHFLYGAHIGRPATLGRSLLVGLIRQPRFLVLATVINLVIVVALAVPFGLFVYALVDGNNIVGLILLSLILLLMAVVFAVWLWVKATAFLPVSAAVVPRGTSALTAAWQLSDGRFWPVFGRLVLLWAMVGTVSTVAQTIGQIMAPTVLFSKLEISSDGRMFVNGRDVDSLDVLAFSDVLPNPIALAAYATAVLVAVSVAQVISTSAIAALYADAKGPNSFGHR